MSGYLGPGNITASAWGKAGSRYYLVPIEFPILIDYTTYTFSDILLITIPAFSIPGTLKT